MLFRCTNRRTIQPVTLKFAIDLVNGDLGEVDCEPDDVFQCQLEGTDHRIHACYVANMPGPNDDREVWLWWEAEDADYPQVGGISQYITLHEMCWTMKYPSTTPCYLFKNHPGKCDWDFIDPERLAATAQLDQILTFHRQHGTFPTTADNAQENWL